MTEPNQVVIYDAKGNQVSRVTPTVEVLGSPGVTDDFWYRPLSEFFAKVTGIATTPEEAEKIGAVYACVAVLSKTLATFPLNILKKVDGNRHEKVNNKLSKILRRSPNPLMDGFIFYESMLRSLLLRGNAYYHKSRNGAGQLLGLFYIHPDQVRCEVVSEKKELKVIYLVREKDNGRERKFRQDQILHIKNQTDDGVKGKSAIQTGVEAFGYSQAIEQALSTLFLNGQRPDGILEFPGHFKDDEATEKFRNKWRETHQGPRNVGEIAILEKGMQYKPISMTNVDAQLVQILSLSVEAIARIFDVPPYRIQDFSRATFSNVEQGDIFWAKNSLLPWVTRIETAINEQIVKPALGDDHFLKFNMNVLLRGDISARTEHYSAMLDRGVYSADEVRAFEDQNPREDGLGADYMVQRNMVPTRRNDEIIDAEIKEPEVSESEGEDSEQKEEEFKALFAEILERAWVKESKALTRALKKPGFLKACNDFYAGHKEYLKDILKNTCLAFNGVKIARTLDRLDGFIDSYIVTRQDFIIEYLDSSMTLEHEFLQWPGEKAGRANFLLKFLKGEYDEKQN